MEIWIPITVAAAAAQTLRFMLQKHLRSTRLSTSGATFARFLYSAPLVAVLLVSYLYATGTPTPGPTGRFWLFAIVGGATQIGATLCVVALFNQRNFAIGITFKKTEVLQTAIVGFLVLGEGVSQAGLFAILIGFLAVVLLSDAPGGGGQTLRRRFLNRAAGLGMLSGVLFAFSAVGYRGASLALTSGEVFVRAGFTLAVVTALQMTAMGLWLAWRDRAQLLATVQAWRVAGLVGVTSMIGSFCWFSAFTLQNAAYVNALGQIEIIFSLMASFLFFNEKMTRRELAGIALLSGAILVLILTI
ncbi:MAG: DMT family transporter [Paracoccaceae bacterium]|nr:DMT family transporter [Paracoccaceae bacterium]